MDSPVSPDPEQPDVAAPAETKENRGKASAKKKLPKPIKSKAAKFPSQPKEKISPSGLRLEPPAEPGKLDDQPVDFEISPEQQQIRDMLTSINPNVLNPHHEIVERAPGPDDDDADRARERRLMEQAVRTASRISDEHNRRLDGLPRRQADGQSQPKQAKTEEVHLSEIAEGEILQAVVESRLSPDEKKALTEAKKKALVPWSENDAWRPISR